MYGWRGRIGLIVPANNLVNEVDFYEHAPEGITVHTSRLREGKGRSDDLENQTNDFERCATLVSAADVDVVVLGSTTGSLVKGAGFESEVEAQLSEVAGVPAAATAGSIKRAFEALGVVSLAIATPYVDELNEMEADFLRESGYEVATIEGLGLDEPREIGRYTPEEIYRHVRGIDHADADAVFLSCTAYRALESVPRLEADVGKPVVTSNQATLWDALRLIDVNYSTLDLGALFRT